MKALKINISGLSLAVHSFSFPLEAEFFEHYRGGSGELKGQCEAVVEVDKRDTFLDVSFRIQGHLTLICDRSLDEFLHPVDVHQRVVFKYGAVPQEVNDELYVITRDQSDIDVGQFMYEFILLQIPMKKLHPRYAESEHDEESTWIFSSDDSASADDQVDPRWEKLKKLK